MERQPGLAPVPFPARSSPCHLFPHGFRFRSVRRRVSGVAALVMSAMAAAGGCLGRAEAATAGPPPTGVFEADADRVASLDAARARTARARALLYALKRATQPGHLLDLLPNGERLLTIEDLRGQYGALQLKAATLATTLGDHHPDLIAAQQALADLRNQLLTAVRTAAAAAEHDLGEARAAESATEHQLASRTADVTGSIGTLSPALAKATPPRPPLDVVAGSGGREASVVARPSRDPEGQTSALTTMADDDWDRLMTALAAIILGALAASIALFALLRPKRPPSRHVNRPIVVPAEPVVEPAINQGVPVLATVAFPAATDAPRLVSILDREPDGTVARSATLIAWIIQRASEAAGYNGHVSVLVTPLSGSVEVETLAASIAVANAAAGHRVLLVDARAHGRFRETLLAGTPVALLLELGSIIRPAYELRVADTTLTLLPSDPAELEAVRWAMARPGAARRRGLSGFDRVVVLGEGVEADAGNLVEGADLVLIAAPAGTSPDALAAASRLLDARGDRTCGAILVEAEEESRIEAPRRTAMPAGSSHNAHAAPRTNRDPTRHRSDRGGFRRTFDPSRDRARA